MGNKLPWSRDITRNGHIRKLVNFLVRVRVWVIARDMVLVSVRVRVRVVG